MSWLNYHHLRYFWAVARLGSVRAAAEELNVTQPTISSQLKQLEEALGTRLFNREGRGLTLTERGEMVQRYAEDIFTIGAELLDALADRPTGHTRRFVVGVADVLPKTAAVKLLESVLSDPTVRLVVQEDPPERLLTRLEGHTLDAVLTDAPAHPTLAPRAVSLLLVESGIALFGTAELTARYRPGFPGSLDGAPLLLPQPHNSLRQGLERWFRAEGLRPDTVGEFDDGALIKAFGKDGFGVFAAPVVVADEVCEQYSVEQIGEVPDVFERFYLVTLNNQAEDSAVRAIRRAARDGLFPPR